jgi:hypothetical protein
MRTLILALVAACSLATAAPVAAQSVAMPAHPDVNLTGFKGDASTLPNAVGRIESVSGGRVVEIRHNNVAGTPGYDVVLAKGSQANSHACNGWSMPTDHRDRSRLPMPEPPFGGAHPERGLAGTFNKWKEIHRGL